MNPSFHPVGGEGTRSLCSSENVNLTKKSLYYSNLEHWKHWNSKPENSAWTVFLDPKMQQVCQDAVLSFQHSYIKTLPPHESIFQKKIFQSTFSEFYNITVSQLLWKSALLWEQAFDLTAISLSAYSNIGIINGQTPQLMSASGESLCCGKETQSIEDSVQFFNSLQVRG